MVLYLEVPLAGIALVLSIVSWKTLRTIRHLDVGKSFWVPILMSGAFFFAGSIAAILSELGVSFDYSVEFVLVSRLLALSILLGGVSMYSRQISRNLAQKFTLPTRPVVAEAQEVKEAPKIPAPVIARVDEKVISKEIECRHDLGYLKTLPKSTPIPDECLSCPKIIECKHSYLIKPERKRKSKATSKSLSEMVIADADSEEEILTER